MLPLMFIFPDQGLIINHAKQADVLLCTGTSRASVVARITITLWLQLRFVICSSESQFRTEMVRAMRWLLHFYSVLGLFCIRGLFQNLDFNFVLNYQFSSIKKTS